MTVNPNTILVLLNGGSLAIDNLIHGPRAIVEAFNPAVTGPLALAQHLFGFENRWGKLPVTMYPHSYITEQDMTNYDMSKSPGRTYKYYQGKPLFKFGFGLSYTDFDMNCKKEKGDVVCKLSNVGERSGDEVVQVRAKEERSVLMTIYTGF